MHVKLELLDSVANNFFDPNFRLADYHILESDEELKEVPGFDDDPEFKNYPVPLPLKHEKYLEEINTLEVFDDDVWVITYPKCGTTWTQEAVWQICNGVTLNESGLSIGLRFPFLEFSSILDLKPSMVERIKAMPRPRFIKSHLPPHFLPKQLWTAKPKIIFVLRDPKDAAVSYYHHYVNIEGWLGAMEDYYQLFLDGKVLIGDYWLYIKSIWALKGHSNVKIIQFEDMKTNLEGTLRLLASFLEKDLTENDFEKLCDHLDFKNMKTNPLVNIDELIQFRKKQYGLEKSEFTFIRKGKIGSHKEEMPENFVELFNQKTMNEFKGLEISYAVDLL